MPWIYSFCHTLNIYMPLEFFSSLSTFAIRVLLPVLHPVALQSLHAPKCCLLFSEMFPVRVSSQPHFPSRMYSVGPHRAAFVPAPPAWEQKGQPSWVCCWFNLCYLMCFCCASNKCLKPLIKLDAKRTLFLWFPCCFLNQVLHIQGAAELVIGIE